MLGLRLDRDTEQRLIRFVRDTRRSKSDVARDAVREYLDRHAVDEEYVRQLRAIAAAPDDGHMDEFEALAADAMADQPDYDWGPAPR